MGKVTAQMSMSLDGFIAGPNASQDNPIGTHGTRLHEWIFDNPNQENSLAESLKRTTGAAIVGYNMYYEALPYWEGSGALGEGIPNFVLAKEDKIPGEAPKVFTFVTDGIESALKQAQTVAGDKDVWIAGGANTIQQYLKVGLLDELHIHLVSVLLGTGTSMFGELGRFIELEQMAVEKGKGVIHITYRPEKK